MAHNNGRDPEWLSDLIVDSYALGESGAAKRHGISRITVARAKRKAKGDPVLMAMINEKLSEVSHDLGVLRVAFLRKALAAAELKLPEASLFETAGAIKIVGELHQTAQMVGDDSELLSDGATESDVVVSKDVPVADDGSTDARH